MLARSVTKCEQIFESLETLQSILFVRDKIANLDCFRRAHLLH